MKVASIVGARPNFIKMAPVSKEIRRSFSEVIIHTGQHYDYEMDKIFFDELGIPDPDYHLGVGSGPHGRQTGEMLKKIEEILLKEKPDVALVFGDTNTTLAGALAATKMHIRVAHVEAGLRSFDRRMPEEANRVLTDHCSDLLFCPTLTSVENLKREGIMKGVYLTGDVTVEALQGHFKIATERSKVLDELDLRPKEYFLATLHRAENTDNYLNLKNITDSFSEIENIVFPCHPRTEKLLKQFKLWDSVAAHVKVTKPMGYYDMLVLEKNARKILTDSGGVQKEAYILDVPCITLRKNTEWVETVSDGWNVLVGDDRELILKMANEFEPRKAKTNVFGNGRASAIIMRLMEELAI